MNWGEYEWKRLAVLLASEIQLPFISKKISASSDTSQINQVVHLKKPEPRRTVQAAGGEPAAIRADRYRVDWFIVAAQNRGVGRRIVLPSDPRAAPYCPSFR
jgi:hypothetical protein